MSRSELDRRQFLKGTVAAGAGVGVLGANTATGEETTPAAEKVPRKVLGSTGVEIPILINGCNHKYDLRYDKRLHHAYAKGVDYIDTAQVYADGQSQKSIGAFIKQVGDRKKLWITSKVMLRGKGVTVERYTKGLDRCLGALESDYLDAFFMHAVDDLAALEPEFLKMGDAMRKSGKIRFFGFSCHGKIVAELIAKAAEVGGIDTIMLRYNFRQYGDLELNKALDAAHKAGIGLIAMKSMGAVPDDEEGVVDWQSKNFTLQQAKLKLIWADERIAGICSQMENIQQIDENTAAAMSPKQLTMAEGHQLNRLAALTCHHYCAGCSRRCESRIHGALRVADTLRYLMYHESYGKQDEARRLYQNLAPAERDLDGIDLAAATAACPQRIDLTSRLAHARDLLGA